MATRICKICGETKDAIQGVWVTVHGNPKGGTCLACIAKIRREYLVTPEGRARHNEISKMSTRKARSTLEGKTKSYEVNLKARTTPEGRIRHNAANRKYREVLDNRVKANNASLAWSHENPEKHNALSAKRRASRRRQTPTWLTKTDYKAMEDMYAMARYFSELAMIPYHVDHVVPLRGKLVSGLHVPSNLCIRLGADNLSKGNKWAP